MRFVAHSPFAQIYVAPLLPAFLKLHTGISLDLRLSDTQFALERSPRNHDWLAGSGLAGLQCRLSVGLVARLFRIECFGRKSQNHHRLLTGQDRQVPGVGRAMMARASACRRNGADEGPKRRYPDMTGSPATYPQKNSRSAKVLSRVCPHTRRSGLDEGLFLYLAERPLPKEHFASNKECGDTEDAMCDRGRGIGVQPGLDVTPTGNARESGARPARLVSLTVQILPDRSSRHYLSQIGGSPIFAKRKSIKTRTFAVRTFDFG